MPGWLVKALESFLLHTTYPLSVRSSSLSEDAHFFPHAGLYKTIMIQTAKKLFGIPNKVIVITGAMSPARFRASDAVFNIGFAAAAVQILPPGVYIAINGKIFDPNRARKNIERNCFEEF